MDNLQFKPYGDSNLYIDIEVTSEEEDEMIGNIAHKIHEYGLDIAAIIAIGSVRPLSFIGAQMGRFFISPFLPALGGNIGITGEKFFQIMEKQENVEKLIQTIEKMTQEEEEQKKAEKAKKLKEKKAKILEGEEPEKKGWRRLFPF